MKLPKDDAIAKFLWLVCCVVDYRSGKYCNFQLKTYSPPHWFGNDSMKSIARGHLNNTKEHIHASLCSFHSLVPVPCQEVFVFVFCAVQQNKRRSAKSKRKIDQLGPDQFTFSSVSTCPITWNLFSCQLFMPLFFSC